MYFLELELTTTGFGLENTFRVSVFVVCVSPRDFLSLTNTVDHQFWLVFFTTLQSPNTTLQSPSLTVDNRVYISTLLSTIK